VLLHWLPFSRRVPDRPSRNSKRRLKRRRSTAWGLGPGGYMAPAQSVGLGPGGVTDSAATVTTSTNGATDCAERGGVGLGPGGRSDECEGAVVNAGGQTPLTDTQSGIGGFGSGN
jgi:hypothetical protein